MTSLAPERSATLQRMNDLNHAIDAWLGDLALARVETTMVYLRRQDKAREMETVRGLTWGSLFPQDATERAEVTTTPEDRRGWHQPRHPEPMGEGSPRQESGTGATTEGVRAEAHREDDREGGNPGSAPAAAYNADDVCVCGHDRHEHSESGECGVAACGCKVFRAWRYADSLPVYDISDVPPAGFEPAFPTNPHEGRDAAVTDAGSLPSVLLAKLALLTDHAKAKDGAA